MHNILASLSALFKSGFLFIQSVSAKFKVSRPVLGDFAFLLSLPSLRHVPQVPIASIGADSHAVKQELFVETDAQPESLAVQSAALQADGPQPAPGGQLAVCFLVFCLYKSTLL